MTLLLLLLLLLLLSQQASPASGAAAGKGTVTPPTAGGKSGRGHLDLRSTHSADAHAGEGSAGEGRGGGSGGGGEGNGGRVSGPVKTTGAGEEKIFPINSIYIYIEEKICLASYFRGNVGSGFRAQGFPLDFRV